MNKGGETLLFTLLLDTSLFMIVVFGPFKRAFYPNYIRFGFLAEWIGALYLGSLVRKGEGSNPSLSNYLVWDGVWCGVIQ